MIFIIKNLLHGRTGFMAVLSNHLIYHAHVPKKGTLSLVLIGNVITVVHTGTATEFFNAYINREF